MELNEPLRESIEEPISEEPETPYRGPGMWPGKTESGPRWYYGLPQAPRKNISSTIDSSHVLPARLRKSQPKSLYHVAYNMSTDKSRIQEPETYSEAIQSAYASTWHAAIESELDSLRKNKTWEWSDLGPGRKALDTKWVFKIKSDGRFKAHLVVKGYLQCYGIDYDKTFAPVAKFDSIRTLMAVASISGYHIHHMDVKTAFLNEDLEEKIYITPPEGIEFGEGKAVLRLRKSLYGLKQAPRAWYSKINNHLKSLGILRSESDHTIYLYNKDSLFLAVAIYVDDILIFSNTYTAVEGFKKELERTFDMADLGPVSRFLGIDIPQQYENGKNILELSQQKYIEQILEDTGLQESNSVLTSGVPNKRLFPHEGTSTADDTLNYQFAVGKLMYLALATGADIAFSVYLVRRFSSNPGPSHWAAVKRIFRYLKGTMDLKLCFDGTDKLCAYTDAKWGGGDDRKSVGAYVFLLAGGAVSWTSKKQATVALSSTEAKYMAVTQVAKHALWISRL